MPGCSASNCNNSTEKGYVMKVFPRDPERRAKWAANVGRKGWNPTNTSFLCEVHFESTMWEKRIDGLRKLKPNAIPTIFGFYLKKQNTKSIKNLNQEQSQFDDVQTHNVQSLPEKSESNIGNSNDINITVIEGSSTQSSQLITATQDIPREHFALISNEKKIEKDKEIIIPLQEESSNQSSDIELITATQDIPHQHFASTSGQEKIEEDKQVTVPSQKNIHKLLNLLNKKTKENAMLKIQLKKIKDAYRKEKKQNERNIYKMQLDKVFTSDQIKALVTKSNRPQSWSNDTIVKALQLKFSERGYEELIKQNIPLPSIRTLQTRLQNLKFTSGISDEIFEFLKIKVSQFEHERDKECSLVMDEMSITPGKVYDTSTHSFLGNVTLPNHTGSATHGLVFMLTGLGARWKQVIGYYFTGNSFNGSILKPIILQILEKAESINLHVNNITSDMGPSNSKLWRELGIIAGRYSLTVNKILHPCDSERYLYIIADAAHLLKNLKACIINNGFIIIPVAVQEKYKLPTNVVHADHFFKLLAEQKDLHFLLTPKLSQSDIDSKNQFMKMRVNSAKHVLSTDVSSGLEFLAEENNVPEYLTTAWFVKTIAKWYTLVTSRHCAVALGKLNVEKFNESISFLYEFINLFKNLRVGKKEQFKPVQRGIIITTTSVIELTNYLLQKRSFKYVLTSRMTQDCIENLFSVIRSKKKSCS